MSILRFPANTAGRDLIVGDVHGCFSRLQGLLDQAQFDPARDRLFSVGDLVDRGRESIKVVEWLAQPWFHAVRGNHEQMAINFSEGHNHAFQYERNGGRWFIDLPEVTQKGIADLFRHLPLAIEVPVDGLRVGIVHAEVPGDDWQRLNKPGHFGVETALWAKNRIVHGHTHLVANIDCVFVGHEPVGEFPEILGNVAYIDTGAVFGNPMVLHQLGQQHHTWRDKP